MLIKGYNIDIQSIDQNMREIATKYVTTTELVQRLCSNRISTKSHCFNYNYREISST